MELKFEVTYDTAHQVRDMLDAALIAGLTTVIVDLTRSTFIDTSGLRELVMANRLAATRHATLKIVPSPVIRRRLELTALDQIIPVSSSVAEALMAASASGDKPDPLVQ